MPTVTEREVVTVEKTETEKKKPNRAEVLSVLTIPISLFFAELTSHIFIFKSAAFNIGLLFCFLSSAFFGGLAYIASTFFKKRGQYIFTAVILGIIAVFFSFHLIYFTSIRSFFSYNIISLAVGVTAYWRETLVFILKGIHKIITEVIPIILFLTVGRKKFSPPENPRPSLNRVVAGILCAAVLFSSVCFPFKRNRDSFLYVSNDISRTFNNYGIVMGSTLDLICTLFGSADEPVENPYVDDSSAESGTVSRAENKNEFSKNILPIDFAAATEALDSEVDRTFKTSSAIEKEISEIAEMNSYFASVPATGKNKYTGMFKGKNLVFITLEAFSHTAIDRERTPTLYKMYTEGFRFTNFYDTLWGGSTATGEYSNITGNFYNTATCLELSAATIQPTALGNVFLSAGYNTFGYHNHDIRYYRRDLSHPNFGFRNFRAPGGGLDDLTNTWPASDLEMAQKTVDDYSSSAPFMTYYISVSGHANFTWLGNCMSAKHRNKTENLKYKDETVKAYLACQYEAELMAEELVARLEKSGQLENTVFALCCDHYPYALSDAALSELYGLDEVEIRNNFDLYRNAFILWSPSMEKPITVDTPCSSYDIAPTLYNLFGLKYDSRLMAGKDILSSSENIVIINTLGNGASWNWITAEGTYNVATNKFTKSKKSTLSDGQIDDYVALTEKKVAAMRKNCFKIIDTNYFSYLFSADGSIKYTLK